MKKIKYIMTLVLVATLMSCNDEPNNYSIKRDPVDLGLSVKWAPMNIGAATPQAMGALYGWSDSLGIHQPNNKDYPIEVKWNNDGMTIVTWNSPYFGGKTPLANISGTDYDIARYMWNSDWRVPTKAEWQELIDKCSWELVNNMEGATGPVYKVTGPSGNHILISLGGINTNGDSEERGVIGHYWTSELLPLSEQASYNYSSTVACAAWSILINPHAEPHIKMEPQVRNFALSFRAVYAK